MSPLIVAALTVMSDAPSRAILNGDGAAVGDAARGRVVHKDAAAGYLAAGGIGDRVDAGAGTTHQDGLTGHGHRAAVGDPPGDSAARTAMPAWP